LRRVDRRAGASELLERNIAEMGQGFEERLDKIGRKKWTHGRLDIMQALLEREFQTLSSEVMFFSKKSK
jgi:hypothetical protein